VRLPLRHVTLLFRSLGAATSWGPTSSRVRGAQADLCLTRRSSEDEAVHRFHIATHRWLVGAVRDFEKQRQLQASLDRRRPSHQEDPQLRGATDRPGVWRCATPLNLQVEPTGGPLPRPRTGRSELLSARTTKSARVLIANDHASRVLALRGQTFKAPFSLQPACGGTSDARSTRRVLAGHH
jgi:hypothetical protein